MRLHIIILRKKGRVAKAYPSAIAQNHPPASLSLAVGTAPLPGRLTEAPTESPGEIGRFGETRQLSQLGYREL